MIFYQGLLFVSESELLFGYLIEKGPRKDSIVALGDNLKIPKITDDLMINHLLVANKKLFSRL